eukprot:TRINITY_DN6858_c0_g1_i2.p1 TRINITY_DN6858_c0_g1~~TRINITY_DN6858_c0_g1_i2.p1  ORF type:complete len:1151 (-),score=183.53 TRINITY_DN6858_c0_g1_i2:269-3721(-)
MTDHGMQNKEQGSGVVYESIPQKCLNGDFNMAPLGCQNEGVFQQDEVFQQPEVDEIILFPTDDDFVRHNSAPVFGGQMKNLKSEGGSQLHVNESNGQLQEEIFINNLNGQRKGCVTLVVQEQQCAKRIPPISNISYQKPQDPRLQFKSMKSLSQKEINAGAQQQEDKNKIKRRLGFGQSLARKEDRSITKIVSSKTPDKPAAPIPPTQPPKFTMPLQWQQKMQIYQKKSADAKNNLNQISEDLNLLTTELQQVEQQGDQLQIQIRSIDQNIDKLDEYPEEGEVGRKILGDENEGDSFEDDDSLTSALLPVNSNSNFFYDSGEEVDQKQIFKGLFTFNNNNNDDLLDFVNFAKNNLKQTYKSAVQFLRIRKVAQSRLNSNNQNSQYIKEENLKNSERNEYILKSLMPSPGFQYKSREKKNQGKFEYQKTQIYLKNFVRNYIENELRIAINYRRQMHQYKRLLFDSNLEDDDEELEIIQPNFKFKFPKSPQQFRTLRSTELAQAVKTIKKGIIIPTQNNENHPFGKWQKTRSKFIGCRSKIQDPVGEMVQELIGSPWTENQINLFVQTFLQYPKEYEKIASFIPGRTSRECVAFYYRNQKQEWFAPTKRKLHMMRRQKRQDIRKAESFMQIQKASQQRMNNQNNLNSNNSQVNICNNITSNNGVNNFSKINSNILSTNSNNNLENSTLNGKNLPPKQTFEEGIKTPFELTGAQRGRRSKRKRAKEVPPFPKFQHPPAKRKCIKPNSSKFQIPSTIKQKRPKIRESQGKETGGSIPPQNSLSIRAKRKTKEQQEKFVEISTLESLTQNALIRSNKIFKTRELSERNFPQNVKFSSSQWESIREPLQIPPLFKNGCSTSPFNKCSSFFTDFLHHPQNRPQTSLFVHSENNNNTSNNNSIDSNIIKKNNSNNFLQPSLTSLLEETIHQALGESVPSSLFQSASSNSNFFQFGQKDLCSANSINRPSTSSSPASFPLGRQATLSEIQQQFQHQQSQRQNLSFPNRKFEPSKFTPSMNFNLNLNSNSKSVVDQVFSSQHNHRFQGNKQYQNSSPFFWRDQFQQEQQQLQGGPQIQQYGQQFLDQRQQFSQFQISGIDSILEKGSVGFNNNNNNNFNKFPLDQYIFNQISDAGLKCAGRGFDGGASSRNIDGDSFNGL